MLTLKGKTASSEIKMITEFESVLCLKEEDGRIIGFYRNDLAKRALKLYKCDEMSMDEIKDLHSQYSKDEKDDK